MECFVCREVPVDEVLMSDFCEMCLRQLQTTGHYEINVMRDGQKTASWRFDKIECVKDFGAKYAHLDDVLKADDERDKQA